jgi:hypothetical protein
MIALTQPSCHNRLKSINSFSVSLLEIAKQPITLAAPIGAAGDPDLG